jgi:UrcA family protein
MKKTLGIILTSFLATTALIKAVPALAEQAPAQNVSIVHTADLNLSTEAGRRHLDERLVHAARDVCGSASDVDLAGKNEVRACRDDVLAKARGDARQIASSGENGSILVAASR